MNNDEHLAGRMWIIRGEFPGKQIDHAKIWLKPRIGWLWCAVFGHRLSSSWSWRGGSRFVNRFCACCDKRILIPVEEHVFDWPTFSNNDTED